MLATRQWPELTLKVQVGSGVAVNPDPQLVPESFSVSSIRHRTGAWSHCSGDTHSCSGSHLHHWVWSQACHATYAVSPRSQADVETERQGTNAHVHGRPQSMVLTASHAPVSKSNAHRQVVHDLLHDQLPRVPALLVRGPGAGAR